MEKRRIDLYVANPPTKKCRRLIELVKETSKEVQEETSAKIEINVLKRGEQSSNISQSDTLTAVTKLYKASALPSVIVDGDIKFLEEIPDKQKLKEAILVPENIPVVNPFETARNRK